ncbi:hypothetical protein [Alteromonas aestuariivivens]|uniref:hypothetical protein n=1 Tax=Alteromonas aestuariivivens TaxID=1938339 RepID=UPI001FE756AC|nr:hypothetical protein [Alteromonas aestuariivivens]
MFNKSIPVIATLVMLSACSSQPLSSIPGLGSGPDINFDNQYLRGVFNWWEASPAYRLSAGSNGWYVDVELIADGQPYDFKLSDSLWTPNNTCGARYNGQSPLLQTPLYLICGSDAQNLQFTPSTTGVYRFVFNPASGGEVQLVISKIGS